MKLEIKDVIKLIDTFANAPIHEMTLKSGDTELKLKKEDSPAPTLLTPSPQPVSAGPSDEVVPQETIEPQMMTQGKRSKLAEAKTNMGQTEKIPSPLVGTFYRSPSPDSPPFVAEGDSVKKGQSIAIVEAMKIMNHLEADFDMEIVRIFAQNGDLIEFGAELFEVRRI